MSTQSRRATIAEEFRDAVDALRSGATATAEEIIISFASDMDTPPGGEDCTEAILAALEWGLKKYGLNILGGYRFFRALARLGRILSTR